MSAAVETEFNEARQKEFDVWAQVQGRDHYRKEWNLCEEEVRAHEQWIKDWPEARQMVSYE